MKSEQFKVVLRSQSTLKVSEPATVLATVCGDVKQITAFNVDASMPAHGHGTNYTPKVSVEKLTDSTAIYKLDGIVLHMPGTWQWQVDISDKDGSESLTQDFVLE